MMMIVGSCIIDTVDLAAYGVFIEKGGSDDFLSFPTRRTPDTNDWAEHDGLDVDLSDLSFDAKRVRINCVLIAPDETAFNHRLNSFEALHFAPGCRRVFVREFNRTFSLRFIGFSEYKHKGGLANPRKKIAKIAVDYIMDDPLQFFTTSVNMPISSGLPTQITLNQLDLSRFGVIVREVYSSALRPRSAKSVLERKASNGTIADVGVAPKRAARQITIECTMIADSLATFFVNYTALWNNLNTTNPIRLGITRTGKTINSYYLRMANFRKETPFSRKVKVSFDLILQEI